MRVSKTVLTLGFAGVLGLVGCSSSDTNNLKLDIEGLADLGDSFVYEGWLIVGGNAVSAGTFSVTDGKMSRTGFSVGADDLDDASKYVLTIEPKPDSDPSPSKTHILAGDFSGNKAMLSVSHGAALGTDFANAAGKYILATPTDDGGTGDSANEKSGVWWLDNSSGTARVGLTLPILPAGWKYEGWAVTAAGPVSTGTFLTATGADDNAMGGPAFPGKDLLGTPPADIKTVVISVEPDPDNSAKPFLLKPLVRKAKSDDMAHTPYTMENKAANNPTGTAVR